MFVTSLICCTSFSSWSLCLACQYKSLSLSFMSSLPYNTSYAFCFDVTTSIFCHTLHLLIFFISYYKSREGNLIFWYSNIFNYLIKPNARQTIVLALICTNILFRLINYLTFRILFGKSISLKRKTKRHTILGIQMSNIFICAGAMSTCFTLTIQFFSFYWFIKETAYVGSRRPLTGILFSRMLVVWSIIKLQLTAAEDHIRQTHILFSCHTPIFLHSKSTKRLCAVVRQLLLNIRNAS